MRGLLLVAMFAVLLVPACRAAQQAGPPRGGDSVAVPATTPVAQSGVYRNLFREIGKTDAEIDAKVNAAVNNFFFGDETIRCYYAMGSDEAYILDSGNTDVRSEGMSYGMMIAVEAGLRPEFDRLWNFARRRLRHASGDRQGYFAWQANTDGSVRDNGSAPDGEEYFAMALLFAWKRWDDPAYKAAADDILHHMLHQDLYVSAGSDVTRMIDPTAKQVVFVPNGEGARFTDPSYHLPAFYELFARWAKEDNAYWREVAGASRAYFKTAAHPTTGLFPDYSRFDGTPTDAWGGGHADFRADAWRVIQNIAIDRYWFGGDPWQVEAANRWQGFFASQGIATYGNMYTLAGKQLAADHSAGLVAMTAVGSLVATNPRARDFVEQLWTIEPTRGRWRYYDGCLYLFGLLHCSGKYKMIGLEPAR
jgi:endo-1,4-beta-D-glucanase Y